MKIGIVTSEVTYIPHNYDNLILPLLQLEEVCLLIELQNRSPALLLKAASLGLMGVTGVGGLLARNTLKTSSAKRRQACQQHGTAFYQLPHMNDAKALELVQKYNLDLLINLRTRCIYRGDILHAPRLGCINVHHGILPRYRGTMCDLYALYEGRAAGFSIHHMEKKVDAGAIYCVQEVSQGDLDYPAYLAKTNVFEFKALCQLIEHLKQYGQLPVGTPNSREQGVVHTKNPTREMIKHMLAKGMKL